VPAGARTLSGMAHPSRGKIYRRTDTWQLRVCRSCRGRTAASIRRIDAAAAGQPLELDSMAAPPVTVFIN
jgi:hypothetical protein